MDKRKMNNYSVEIKRYKDLKDITTLPIYQRQLVWSKRQKEEFIDSIKEGFPFGSLLVYKYSDENEDKLSIIDGLQRFSTLKNFEENKHEYYPIEKGIEEVFVEVIQGRKEIEKKEIIAGYKKIILDSINNKNDLNAFQVATKLDEQFATNYELGYFYERYQKICEEVNSYIDLDNLEIPYVYFKGKVSDLAEVFQRLNRGGVKLSKYQVFASRWVKYNIKLNDMEINKKIMDITVERYNRLNTEREGIKIEDYEENEFREKKQVNLAEFCYSFGKLILESSNVFYDKKDRVNNEDLANEIGHATLGIILGVENNRMADIADSATYIVDEDIEKIFNAALKIYTDINNKFKMYLQVPKKDKEKYFNKNITNFMYLSYFASLWTIKYNTSKNFNLEEKQGSKFQYEKILDNIIYYYISDSITGYWSATGDKKLNEFYVGKNYRNKYTEKFDKNNLEMNLYSWIEEESKKSSVNISDKVRLIIVVLNNLEKKGIKNDGINNADFEHIFVKKYINKAKKENNTRQIPGGHLGNICLLTEHENRKKKENTLYYSNEKHAGFTLNDEYLEIIDYPSVNQISYVDTMDVSEENVDKMIEYIEKRAKNISNSLINILYK